MKRFTIFCDGGLGNRLGVLVGGILFAKKLNRAYTICWPVNAWCGCEFNDLFTNDIPVIKKNINELFSENIKNTFIIHENQTTYQLDKRFYPNEESIDLCKELDGDIIYYNNSVPGFFHEEEIIDALNTFKIKNNILEAVYTFCEENKITEDTHGIHFRKTDYGNLINENEFEELIKNNQTKSFFVCSDEKNTEEKFLKYTNVIIHRKENYVEKLRVESGWCDNIVDSENRSFRFNVNRPKDSVIEAFIDMLILSRTNITVDTISSFLKFAKYYRSILK